MAETSCLLTKLTVSQADCVLHFILHNTKIHGSRSKIESMGLLPLLYSLQRITDIINPKCALEFVHPKCFIYLHYLLKEKHPS